MTQSIREADAKGRHTTTARSLRRTLAGGWLIDTPGMRELRLSQAREGIDAVFADLRAQKRSWKKRTKNGRAQAKMKNKGWGD